MLTLTQIALMKNLLPLPAIVKESPSSCVSSRSPSSCVSSRSSSNDEDSAMANHCKQLLFSPSIVCPEICPGDQQSLSLNDSNDIDWYEPVCTPGINRGKQFNCFIVMVINYALEFNQLAKSVSLDESMLAFYNDALCPDDRRDSNEATSGNKRPASSPTSSIDGQ